MLIESLVAQLYELKAQIKAIEKSMKNLTPKPDKVEDLKKTRKDITKEIKTIQDELEREMNEDEEIKEFKKKKVLKEEELAELQEKLFQEIYKNGKEFRIEVPCSEGSVKVETQKAMKLYFNGREVKERK